MECNLKLVKNAVGRKVPTIINHMKAVPYKGVGKHPPKGVKDAPPIRSCQDYPASGNKVAANQKEALIKCGLKNDADVAFNFI